MCGAERKTTNGKEKDMKQDTMSKIAYERAGAVWCAACGSERNLLENASGEWYCSRCWGQVQDVKNDELTTLEILSQDN